ncbi:MAG: signal peptidase I [Actinomycetota bacterium]
MAETEARDHAAAEHADIAPDGGGAPVDGEPTRSRRFIGSTPFLILVAVGVAILVKTFLIQAFFIPSASMVPTLEVGDRVFVNKFVYDFGDVERGDVIVFENPDPGAVPDRGMIDGFVHWLGEGIGFAQPEDEDFIKRVVGLPGETIEIRDDVVYIDGEPLDEPYLTSEARRANGDFPPTTIPGDSLFVMGDNRGNSADSRYGLGFVPLDRVIGEAFIVIWPPSHLGGLG